VRDGGRRKGAGAVDEEKFLDSLGEEAEREMRRIDAQTEGEVQRILAEAEESAGRARAEGLRVAEAEARTLRSRIVNTARLEGRRSVLLAVRHLAEEALEALREEVRVLSSRDDYRRILEGLFDECAIPVGGRLICRPSDRDLLEEVAAERGCTLDFEEASLPLGGFTVLSGDRRFAQRNTFEDRILRARRRLLMILGERILSQDEGGGGGDV
jgi:vacuolar-type H+-ATPase subunit E/Vma4